MERITAIRLLNQLKGQDLHKLAVKYEVTVTGVNGKANKGWAGHVLERFLGLPQNSAQSPNFGSWELKSVPITLLKDGNAKIKETMAITMIDPYNVQHTPFSKSHLLAKLNKIVIVSRTVGLHYLEPSFVYKITPVDLTKELYESVKEDYELVRECISDPNRGFNALSGHMGKYIQPRTKGSGHGSTTRAFYARKNFLSLLINI